MHWPYLVDRESASDACGLLTCLIFPMLRSAVAPAKHDDRMGRRDFIQVIETYRRSGDKPTMPTQAMHFFILILLPAGLAAQVQLPDRSSNGPSAGSSSQQMPSRQSVPFARLDENARPSHSVEDLLLATGTPKETSALGAEAIVQMRRSALERKDNLPDAPQPQSAEQQKSVTPASSDQARISGLVLDPSGAAVYGADITLSTTTGSQQLTVKSGADGRFIFTKLAAGSYVVTVGASGFTTFQSKTLILAPQQMHELSQIVLAIATADTEVTVRPTEQIAAEQLKAEEHQRVFGLFPNFFTSYVYDAAPLTGRQKLSLTAHDIFDPVSMFGVAAIAGIQQAERTYPGYGNDAPGFGKRFGAALGDTLTNDFLSHAVFPTLLHEDPRYYYQGSGTKKQRLFHAVSYAFVTRSDSGHRTPNLSYILGDIGSGALSNLYYPHADRGVGLVFTQAAIGVAGQAAGAVVREFLSRRLTTNVPGEGKP